MNPHIRVLFVCMGNICRSPMAEAVFRHLVDEAGLSQRFKIDSAGTGGWHAGERPHRGTIAVLDRHGIDEGGQRARQIAAADIAGFDYIVAMDDDNLSELAIMFGPPAREKARLLLDFAPQTGRREVPDPYYSGGFDTVFELVRAGSQGLLSHIRTREGF